MDFDQDYRTCKGSPHCSICEGSLCNHWETLQESELHCSFCHAHDSENFCNGGEDTRQCPVVVTHGRNIYCFTAFDLSTGFVQERGCMDDSYLSEIHGHFLVPCWHDNCNAPAKLDEFYCVSFSGFVSKFEHQKQTIRCNRNVKSRVSGCFTIFKGKAAELGCISQLSFHDFVNLSKEDEGTVQFCYEPNCNGIIGGFHLKEYL